MKLLKVILGILFIGFVIMLIVGILTTAVSFHDIVTGENANVVQLIVTIIEI